MAKQLENEKGFLLIKTSREEILSLNPRNEGICDGCGFLPNEGVYIAVLNSWYCPECFGRWVASAVRFSEDINFEEKKFWSVYNALMSNYN